MCYVPVYCWFMSLVPTWGYTMSCYNITLHHCTTSLIVRINLIKFNTIHPFTNLPKLVAQFISLENNRDCDIARRVQHGYNGAKSNISFDHLSSEHKQFNSLAPGWSEFDSKNVIFNLVLLIGIIRSPHDNDLRWMPQDHTDDKSTLVQVMAWCLYLSQWAHNELRGQVRLIHTLSNVLLLYQLWYHSHVTL